MQHITQSGAGGFSTMPQKCAECGGDMFANGCGGGIYCNGVSYHSHCWSKKEADAAWRRDVLASLARIEALLQKSDKN